MEGKKINLIDFLCRVLSLYLLTTVTQRLFNISVGRVLGFIIIIILAVIMVKESKIKQYTVVYMLVGLLAIGTLYAMDKQQHIVDTTYLVATVLLLLQCSNKRFLAKVSLAIIKNSKLIVLSIFAFNLILVISYFDPKSFMTIWGDGTYFYSYSNSSHTLASACCLCLALNLIYVKRVGWKIYNFLFMLIPIIAIFQSGARTFIIPAGIMVYLFVQHIIKSKLARIICYALVAISFTALIFQSEMINKMEYALNNSNGNEVIFQFTSGRSEFWEIDLDAFKEYSMLNKVVGKGFDYVYLVNENEYGRKIWAHNDFIMLLLSTGILGTCVYIYCLFSVFRTIVKESNKNSIPVIIYVVFPAIINGFFMYQHLVYSTIFIATFNIQISIKDR